MRTALLGVVVNVFPGFMPLSHVRSHADGRGKGRVAGLGSEVDPAARTKLGLLPDHASGDAIDTRDLGAAQAECVAHAGLLLLKRISPALRRPNAY
jgi:hypothetical protein